MGYKEVKLHRSQLENCSPTTTISIPCTSFLLPFFLVGRNTHISWSEIPIFHQDVLSFLHTNKSIFLIKKKKKKRKERKEKCLTSITCNGYDRMIWKKYLLANVCLLHSLVRHETKVNVWEVGPLTQRKQNGFVKGPHTVDRFEETTIPS